MSDVKGQRVVREGKGGIEQFVVQRCDVGPRLGYRAIESKVFEWNVRCNKILECKPFVNQPQIGLIPSNVIAGRFSWKKDVMDRVFVFELSITSAGKPTLAESQSPLCDQ